MPSAIAWPFFITSVACGINPVMTVLRAGEQTGWVQYDSVKLTPSATRLSINGVSRDGLPLALRTDINCWSVMISSTLGLCDSALAPLATARDPEAVRNERRLRESRFAAISVVSPGGRSEASGGFLEDVRARQLAP